VGGGRDSIHVSDDDEILQGIFIYDLQFFSFLNFLGFFALSLYAQTEIVVYAKGV
jgi:hypothetical protein